MTQKPEQYGSVDGATGKVTDTISPAFDIDTMTEQKKLNDQEILTAARSIISEWAMKEGHALCHQHPEILARLAHVLGVPVVAYPPLPARQDFEIGCKAYHDFLYNPRPPAKEAK